ncbi:hypothetical protein D3C84_1083990 [compost metagenome]
MQAIGDAGAGGLVEGVEQVHAGAVVGQVLAFVGRSAELEVGQQARHPPRLHQRHQGIVQWHQQAQAVHPAAPEAVLAEAGD